MLKNKVGFSLLVKKLCRFCLLTCCLTISAAAIAAQTYDSGSTGADGPLDLSADYPGCPAAQSVCVIQLPPNGVFNFTTVNIPVGKDLRFIRNATNTPVFILAQGEVRIFGTINVNGEDQFQNQPRPEFNFPSIGGLGGPGGFDGGAVGTRFPPYTSGLAGNGPGGGGGGNNSANPTSNNDAGGGGGGFAAPGGNANGRGVGVPGLGGLTYGNRSLVPLVGGSGGGGGASLSSRGVAGGGGGGAILIASSTIIRFRDDAGAAVGVISARGGQSNPNVGNCSYGGGGSGGAIRLAAVQITGRLNLNVIGGTANGNSTCGGGTGSSGRLRLEAYSYSGSTFDFPGPLSNETLSITQFPYPAMPLGNPTLRITSVANLNIPDPPSGSPHGTVDLFLQRTVPNPVTMNIAATNVPPGTIVRVTTQPNSGPRVTVDSTPLSGTTAASTATASVTIPDGISLTTATVTFFPQQVAGTPKTVNGKKIERVEVTAKLGGTSEITYVAVDGTRFKEGEAIKER